jgi:deoxyribodipyrimidine photo-lyase
MLLGLYIFRRDLRIIDNISLYLLSKKCNFIIPIFILDKNQIKENDKNKNYFSYNTVQFICESLIDLDKELKKKNSRLHLYYGEPDKIISKIIKKLKGHELIIGFNKDYSKYAEKRDKKIKDICNRDNIEICSENDITLIAIEKMLLNETAYKQFGPFYKNAIKTEPKKPIKTKINFIVVKTIEEYKIDDLEKLHNNVELRQKGNRKFFINILNNIDKFRNYDEIKNDLSCNTTNISAGLISF